MELDAGPYSFEGGMVMAWSKCPSCNATSFEAAEIGVAVYKYKLIAVQCASCGAVVGVTPSTDPGVQGELLMKEIKELRKEVAALAARVAAKR